MGVVTSSQGILDPASTTRGVMGGDQQMQPSIGGGGGASVAASPAVQATAATGGLSVTRGPRTGSAGGGATKSTLGLRPTNPFYTHPLRRSMVSA